MNNDNDPNTSSEQCGLNTGESVYLIGQLISLKITSTISQENWLSPTKYFSIAIDTDVVQVYKLFGETEQMGNPFLLFLILYFYTSLSAILLLGLAAPVAIPNQELL